MTQEPRITWSVSDGVDAQVEIAADPSIPELLADPRFAAGRLTSQISRS